MKNLYKIPIQLTEQLLFNNKTEDVHTTIEQASGPSTTLNVVSKISNDPNIK